MSHNEVAKWQEETLQRCLTKASKLDAILARLERIPLPSVTIFAGDLFLRGVTPLTLLRICDILDTAPRITTGYTGTEAQLRWNDINIFVNLRVPNAEA